MRPCKHCSEFLFLHFAKKKLLQILLSLKWFFEQLAKEKQRKSTVKSGLVFRPNHSSISLGGKMSGPISREILLLFLWDLFLKNITFKPHIRTLGRRPRVVYVYVRQKYIHTSVLEKITNAVGYNLQTFFLESFFYIFGLLWKTYDGKSNQCNDANVNMVVNFAITLAKKFEISVLASTYLKKSEKMFKTTTKIA